MWRKFCGMHKGVSERFNLWIRSRWRTEAKRAVRLKILPKWDGKDLTHVSDVVKGNFIHALIYSIFGKNNYWIPGISLELWLALRLMVLKITYSFLGFGVLLAGILEGISKDWKMGPHPTSSACWFNVQTEVGGGPPPLLLRGRNKPLITFLLQGGSVDMGLQEWNA